MTHCMRWATSCCLALALSQPVHAAERAVGGGFSWDYGDVNKWRVERVSSDEAGRTTLHCHTIWSRESDAQLYARLDAASKATALGLTAVRPPPSKATVSVWFDDQKASATEGRWTFIPWSPDDPNFGYLVLTETGDKKVLMERLAKARKVTFAYSFEGKTRTEAFPFKSAQQAMKKLADCANGR